MRKIKHIVPFLCVAVAGFAPQVCQGQYQFTKVTDSSGINHQFVVYEGMFGGGACVLDINNDGWEDIYLTGGMADDALYLNNKDGTFKNIFESSGLVDTRKFVTQGVATADLNKDGFPDLFVTTITERDSAKQIPRAENLVFLNNGNLTFRNATDAFGLKTLQSFSTGVCFGDFDLDGFTDAYVGNYFFGYEGSLSYINDSDIVRSNQAAAPYLLRNLEGKRFKEVSEGYGIKFKGFGFGGSFTDYDRDADLDLFVNNDFGFKAMPNVLLENMHPSAKMTEKSRQLNLDLAINAMGTAIGDFDNNGLLDYYVTNIRFNRFMVNHGKGKAFTEEAKVRGLDYVSISWGANFADFDHDTDLDLFVANGDLNPNDVPLADYYFVNNNGHFKESAPAHGLNDYGIGRGSVVFDMDNDGDLDLLVVNQKAVLDYPVPTFTNLYRNDRSKGNWLKIKLQGVESDRNGIGALIEIQTDSVTMIREIDGGSGHLSQNSTIAHFGLGNATVVQRISVTWPGGKRQALENQGINQLLIINEIPTQNDASGAIWLAILIASTIALSFIFFARNRSSKANTNVNVTSQ